MPLSELFANMSMRVKQHLSKIIIFYSILLLIRFCDSNNKRIRIDNNFQTEFNNFRESVKNLLKMLLCLINSRNQDAIVTNYQQDGSQ